MSDYTTRTEGLDEAILRTGRPWADALPDLAREALSDEPATERLTPGGPVALVRAAAAD